MLNVSHKLSLIRCRQSVDGTFGRLFFGDDFLCYTLEPAPSVVKPYPIPCGMYHVRLDIVSPKYRFRQPYATLCKGCVPRLMDVPGFDGILIHIGNWSKDTKGCILVGQKASLHRLYNSKLAFVDLYNRIKDCKNLHIEIQMLNDISS